jgi:hypothetical protein
VVEQVGDHNAHLVDHKPETSRPPTVRSADAKAVVDETTGAGHRPATGRTTARNTRTTYGDDQDMTDETTTAHGPNPEDPEDRQVALITALIKIFGTDRGDSSIEPAPRHPR